MFAIKRATGRLAMNRSTSLGTNSSFRTLGRPSSFQSSSLSFRCLEPEKKFYSTVTSEKEETDLFKNVFQGLIPGLKVHFASRFQAGSSQSVSPSRSSFSDKIEYTIAPREEPQALPLPLVATEPTPDELRLQEESVSKEIQKVQFALERALEALDVPDRSSQIPSAQEFSSNILDIEMKIATKEGEYRELLEDKLNAQKKKLAALRQYEDLEHSLATLETKLADIQQKQTLWKIFVPSSFEPPVVRNFLVYLLGKEKWIRPNRLTTNTDRMSFDFLNQTFNRGKQLEVAYNFIVNPTVTKQSEKSSFLLTIAGRGTGKTHFVDEISRAYDEMPKRKLEIEAQLALLEAQPKEKKDPSISLLIHDLHRERDDLVQTISSIEHLIPRLKKENIILTVCFNSRTNVIVEEKYKEILAHPQPVPPGLSLWEAKERALKHKSQLLKVEKDLKSSRVLGNTSVETQLDHCQSVLSQALTSLEEVKNYDCLAKETPFADQASALLQDAEDALLRIRSAVEHVKKSANHRRVSSMLIARILYTHFVNNQLDYTTFVSKFGVLINSLTLKSALEVVQYDLIYGGEDEDPAQLESLRKDPKSRVFLMVDEISKVEHPSDRAMIYEQLCQLCDTHGSPYSAMVTSLEPMVVKNYDFEMANYDSPTHRRLVFLRLTPFTNAVWPRVRAKFPPFVSDKLINYVIAVTSGHWRTLELLCKLLENSKRFMFHPEDEEKRISDFERYNRLLEIYYSSLGYKTGNMFPKDYCFTVPQTDHSMRFESDTTFTISPKPEDDTKTKKKKKKKEEKEKDELVHPKAATISITMTGFEKELYKFIRLNLLKKMITLSNDKDDDEARNSIGCFIFSSFLINGFERDFDQVPLFSITQVLVYIVNRKATLSALSNGEIQHQLNPFLSDLEKLLNGACGFEPPRSGDALENFQAYYEMMRRMVDFFPTLDDYCAFRLDMNTNVNPTKRTLSELYEGFIPKTATKDMMTLFVPGSIVTKYTKVDQRSVKDGAIVMPASPTNAGFDLLIKTKVIKDGNTEQDGVILVECKSHSPLSSGNNEKDSLQTKLNIIQSSYGSDNVFKWGAISVPMENVSVIFLSAFETDNQLPSGGSDVFDFPGVVLASTNQILSSFYGSPLNNCGLFLQDVDSFATGKKKTLKITKPKGQ